MGLRLVDFSMCPFSLLVQDSLEWVFDTLYPWYQQYHVLKKQTSGFELALWELLFDRSAWSEATSLTRVLLERVSFSKLLTMLEILAVSRYPAIAALTTASDIFFK